MVLFKTKFALSAFSVPDTTCDSESVNWITKFLLSLVTEEPSGATE